MKMGWEGWKVRETRNDFTELQRILMEKENRKQEIGARVRENLDRICGWKSIFLNLNKEVPHINGCNKSGVFISFH